MDRSASSSVASGALAKPKSQELGMMLRQAVGDSEIFFQGWVNIVYRSTEVKTRVLVITNFRILTLKVGSFGVTARQRFPIALLETARVSHRMDKIWLKFKGDPYHAIVEEREQLREFVMALQFVSSALTYGRPEEETPKFSVPAPLLVGYLPPHPSPQEGLIAAYMAACDLLEIPENPSVLDYFMACFQENVTLLDLADCLAVDKKPKDYKNEIVAIFDAFKYSRIFTQVTVRDLPVRNEGLLALISFLNYKTSVDTITIDNIKATSAAFVVLGEVIGADKHNLKALAIANNNVGDSGLVALLKGLQRCKTPLKEIMLLECAFGDKGFQALGQSLRIQKYLSTLRLLEIANCKAESSGSTALVPWLEGTIALEELHLPFCDVDTETIVRAIEKNPNCKLNTLNLAGNKMGERACLALSTLITTTNSLSRLFLGTCGLKPNSFASIVDAAMGNQHRLKFSLDFSQNELGHKGIQELQRLFLDWGRKDVSRVTELGLHTLILNNNSLGSEGIIEICKVLSGSGIRSLSLDSNMKSVMFSSLKDASETLSRLILSTLSLTELSVRGDGTHYLKSSLNALFDALKGNNTLVYLNVARNRLGDKGILTLGAALQANNTLTALDFDQNRFSLQGLQQFADTIKNNTALTNMVIPMSDIEILLRSAPARAGDLRKIVRGFEAQMERNRGKFKEEKNLGPQVVPTYPLIHQKSVRDRRSTVNTRKRHQTASTMFENLVAASAEEAPKSPLAADEPGPAAAPGQGVPTKPPPAAPQEDEFEE